jgi:hypothetical protein
MVTTGIFLVASDCRAGAIAAVSCGAMAMPLTPWLMNDCTFEVGFATSFWELVVFSSNPSSSANWGVYLM